MRQLLAMALAAATAAAATLTPAWVELGPSGKVLVRVVVAKDCPSVAAGGKTLPMTQRTPVPAGFLPACEVELPAGSRRASMGGQKLVLPTRAPVRVVAIGDTGCRVKGNRVQNCNDPEQWPFAKIAQRAAASKPQLVVHVGDYLYREMKCPDPKFCAGSPDGDNWPTWNADFFKPAAPLLAAAPWAFSRGNHESCNRSWRGWFYYLDPGPWTNTCTAASEPYIAQAGTLRIAMLDSSAVNDATEDESQIEAYAKELRSVSGQAPWLADHHPFWAWRAAEAASKPPESLTGNLQKAWDRALPVGFELVLSGHTHLFEYWKQDPGHPAQLVAGDSGTDLAFPVKERPGGVAVHEFGYTTLTRKRAKDGSPWKVELTGLSGKTLADCAPRGCR